jgi:hypothetical protein
MSSSISPNDRAKIRIYFETKKNLNRKITFLTIWYPQRAFDFSINNKDIATFIFKNSRFFWFYCFLFVSLPSITKKVVTKNFAKGFP